MEISEKKLDKILAMMESSDDCENCPAYNFCEEGSHCRDNFMEWLKKSEPIEKDYDVVVTFEPIRFRVRAEDEEEARIKVGEMMCEDRSWISRVFVKNRVAKEIER